MMGFGLHVTMPETPWSSAVTPPIADATTVALNATLADAVLLATRPPSEGGAPRDTGRLAASITFRVIRNGDWIVGLFGVFDSAVHYAMYQELGTRYIRPRLFLRRAWEETYPKFPKRLEELTGG
jgi:hypothetical protein